VKFWNLSPPNTLGFETFSVIWSIDTMPVGGAGGGTIAMAPLLTPVRIAGGAGCAAMFCRRLATLLTPINHKIES
jgi:hypothetical protein